MTNAANWPTAASPFRKDLVPPSVHPSSVQRVSVVPTRHIKHGSTSETPSSPRSLRAETNYGSKRRQRQGNDRVLNLQDPKLPPESLAGKCSVNFSVFKPSSTASLRNTPHEQAGFHFQQWTFNRAQRRERLVEKSGSQAKKQTALGNERKSEREKTSEANGVIRCSRVGERKSKRLKAAIETERA